MSLLFSSTWLSAATQQNEAVDAIFAKWDQPDVPGAAVGVFHEGQIIYARGYGMANLEYDIPNSPDSVFRIGSTSKQFTAACVVLLAQQGKLKLTDTLDQYFPDFPAYAKKITINQLMHHSSGVRDYLMLAFLKGLSEAHYYQDKDVMQWLVKQTELNFEPGEEHLYSNSGYWLLGQIVNKAAGMNMADYATQEIFKPLGMTHTHFHNDHKRIVKNRASGYLPTGEFDYEISMTHLDMIGDGGVFTTINDIKKWDDAFYDSEVLNAEFWQIMTQVGVLNNGEKMDYAGGLIMDEYKGLETISHGGAFVGYRAELLRFPSQKFSVAIFTNRGDANPSSMALEVADVFLEKFYQPEQESAESDQDSSEQKAEAELKEMTHEQLVGGYELQPGIRLLITEQGGVLHTKQLWNGKEYDLTPNQNTNQFQIADDTKITFTFSALSEGHSQVLTVFQMGKNTPWNRVNDFDASGVDLNDFVGDYHSEELAVTYHLRMADEQLTVQVGNIEPVVLNVAAEDELTYQGSIWKFDRNEDQITGFKMTAGRVQNLKFTKR